MPLLLCHRGHSRPICALQGHFPKSESVDPEREKKMKREGERQQEKETERECEAGGKERDGGGRRRWYTCHLAGTFYFFM